MVEIFRVRVARCRCKGTWSGIMLVCLGAMNFNLVNLTRLTMKNDRCRTALSKVFPQAKTLKAGWKNLTRPTNARWMLLVIGTVSCLLTVLTASLMAGLVGVSALLVVAMMEDRV